MRVAVIDCGMDTTRAAQRVAVAVQWLVYLGWGWAIWHHWDNVELFWLAFGVTTFIVWAFDRKRRASPERPMA